MARTFKALHGDDVVNTRTLLHEAIPITGTISSGTYVASGADENIKTFSHGMFESVYDYPYLSSSANHIFDITFGLSSFASASTAHTQQKKKLNIYNQMAQTLLGYDSKGNIQHFYSNAVSASSADNGGAADDLLTNDLTYGSSSFSSNSETGRNNGRMDHVFFFNFSRLLVKDEIKKNSFRLQLFDSGSVEFKGGGRDASANTATATQASISIVASNAPDATDELTLVAHDGTSLVFTAHASTTNGAASPPTFSRGGTKHGLDNLKTAIEASGLSSYLTVGEVTGDSPGPYTLVITQNLYGPAGNTTVTSDCANWNINEAGAATSTAFAGGTKRSTVTYGDYLSANQFRTSPSGDYGLLVTSSTADNNSAAGLIFYQAGVAVLTSSVFRGEFATPQDAAYGDVASTMVQANLVPGEGVSIYQTGSTIEKMSDAFRHFIYDIDFNNTIELNSAIYFCRVNHNDFNYSSNPTYVDGSKLRVKNNVNDLPISYITTVGLYSPDNELLAVAKLSEPIRKDPNTELTLRVRLDY